MHVKVDSLYIMSKKNSKAQQHKSESIINLANLKVA